MKKRVIWVAETSGHFASPNGLYAGLAESKFMAR